MQCAADGEEYPLALRLSLGIRQRAGEEYPFQLTDKIHLVLQVNNNKNKQQNFMCLGK
jgi:hypothetical protein